MVNPPKRRTKEYTDIQKVLRGQPLANGTAASVRESAERYASIFLVQNQKSHTSLLSQNFTEKMKDGAKTLSELRETLQVGVDILQRSPEIDPLTQDRAYRSLDVTVAPYVLRSAGEISFASIRRVLEVLYGIYNWGTKEPSGRRALFRKNATEDERQRRLNYWALLTHQWIAGQPVSRVISRSLSHYEQEKIITIADFSGIGNPYKKVPFDLHSKQHVNQVIEDVLSDLEYGVGFRILTYLKNYYDLCVSIFGPDEAGLELAILIEFGTTDQVAIELQQIGFTRESASELRKKARNICRWQRGEKF